jgi:hypothetical protein
VEDVFTGGYHSFLKRYKNFRGQKNWDHSIDKALNLENSVAKANESQNEENLENCIEQLKI